MKKSGLAWGCAAAIAVLSWTSSAWAQMRSFDVPAGPAVKAIPEFARQAGIQIVAPAGRLMDVVTAELKGELDVRVALRQLIAGTALEVVSDNGEMVVLRLSTQEQSSNAETGLTVEEVIVTATRRSERLQDVPLSISALGESQLSAMGADGFLGFYRNVPGLTFNPGDAGRGSFIIRGINAGEGDNQAPVAVYIDEFPTDDSRGARALTDLNLFDVERVEVLRGPQGTLFGSGALGGAIRVITNKPDPTRFAVATEGDYSTISGGESSQALKGMLNLPLVENKLALRAVGYYRDDGGYVDNLATGRKDVNDSTSRGGRVALKLFATDELTLTATVVHQEADVGESAALDDTGIDGVRVRSNAQPSSFNSKVTTYNLVVDYDLPIAQLMSSTTLGRKETDLRQGFEDGLFGLPLITGGPDTSDNIAQELRLTSARNGRASWVAGAFYFKRKRDAQSVFTAPGAGEIFGAPSDILIDADLYMRDTEKALYGELSYELTDQWKATAGLRWFENEAEYHDRQQGLMVDGVIESGLLRNTESEVTPKFVLSYQPSKDRMMYVSAAKGYRIGGTNIPNTADSAVPAAYAPDSLWNYEIGAKTTWLDTRLALNVALYYIDWKDIQIERTSLVNEIGYQDNGGAAHSQGLEIEASVRPVTGLTLSTALSWSSARSDETVLGTNILDGDRLPDARDFTGSASVEYTRPLSSVLAFFTRADYQYVGDAYADFSNALAPMQESYSLVNLRVGMHWGAWTASLYADNLLDDDHIAHVNDTGTQAYLVRPRSIGINVRAEF